MVITMAKVRMAHASTYGAHKPPGPIYINLLFVKPFTVFEEKRDN